MARVLIPTGDAAEKPGHQLPVTWRSTTGPPPRSAAATDREQAGAAFVDGVMVSCRGWPELPAWSRAFVQVPGKATVPA